MKMVGSLLENKGPHDRDVYILYCGVPSCLRLSTTGKSTLIHVRSTGIRTAGNIDPILLYDSRFVGPHSLNVQLFPQRAL